MSELERQRDELRLRRDELRAELDRLSARPTGTKGAALHAEAEPLAHRVAELTQTLAMVRRHAKESEDRVERLRAEARAVRARLDELRSEPR